MNHHQIRIVRAAAAAVLLAAAAQARAQVNLTVAAPSALSPSPLVNAVTHGTASSFYLDVTNSKAGTILRQIEFRLPQNWVAQGGAGPDGWTVSRIQSSAFYSVRFQVTDCSVTGIGGIGPGATGRFRLDITPPGGAVSGDWSDTLARITAGDPCGGATGWNVSSASSVTIPVKTLAISGSVSPGGGAAPLTATSTWTVANLSTAAQTATPSVTVTPSGGSSVACTPAQPASLSLAAAGAPGASATFTCAYTIGQTGSYLFAATANGAGANTVGTTAGPVAVGGVSTTFAFDSLSAGPGDQVNGTMTFTNNTSGSVTVSPPAYASLTLTGLAKSNGVQNPSAVTLGAGQSGIATYTFSITGVVGSRYQATGTPTVTTPAGTTTNAATTPPGTVTASSVTWSPRGIVPFRSLTGPWTFSITVANNAATSIKEIDVVNPQPSLWGGMAAVNPPAGSVPKTQTTANSTTVQFQSLSVAPKTSITLQVSFTSIPSGSAVTKTTEYPFTVKTVAGASGNVTTSYDDTLAIVPTPVPDVFGLTILSTGTGQTLAWTNTDGTNGTTHDGVAVFRVAMPTQPFHPADFVDYSDPLNQALGGGNSVVYADRTGSTVAQLSDGVTGAYAYRVCNHDALFVYSDCKSGFWNGAGYLDSEAAPAGGWTHQLGGGGLILPGVIGGGRVAVANSVTNGSVTTSIVTVLDLSTGARTHAPVALTAVPAAGTPAGTMVDGRQLMFGADQNGYVFALDVGSAAKAWDATFTGEGFTATPAGILKSFANAAYTAPYDTILFASTSGHVLGLKYDTGAMLWTVNAGGTLSAPPLYDFRTTNRLFVPVDGGAGGVLAFDVGAGSGTPQPVSGWPSGAANAGSFQIACVFGPLTTDLACIDRTGMLTVRDTTTGATKYGTPYATGAANPMALRAIGGTTMPGYVVSTKTSVERLLAPSTGSVSVAATWTAPAGVALAPAQAFPGWTTPVVVVAADDKKLRKLDLSTLAPIGALDLPSASAANKVGPPVFDTATGRFVFSTEIGRVFAVPAF